MQVEKWTTHVDTMSIVCDLDQLETSVLEHNLDRGRACIHGILDQFLQCVYRSYDNFSSRDLVNHVLLQGLVSVSEMHSVYIVGDLP